MGRHSWLREYGLGKRRSDRPEVTNQEYFQPMSLSDSAFVQRVRFRPVSQSELASKLIRGVLILPRVGVRCDKMVNRQIT